MQFDQRPRQRSFMLVLVQCLVGSVLCGFESSFFCVCHCTIAAPWRCFSLLEQCRRALDCHFVFVPCAAAHEAKWSERTSCTRYVAYRLAVQRQGRQDVVRWWSHKCITSTTTRSMNWINDCRRLRMHEGCEGVVVTVSVYPPTILDLTP